MVLNSVGRTEVVDEEGAESWCWVAHFQQCEYGLVTILNSYFCFL